MTLTDAFRRLARGDLDDPAAAARVLRAALGDPYLGLLLAAATGAAAAEFPNNPVAEDAAPG